MNIDEFLDSVAASNVSKTPITSTAVGVNALPSDQLVKNVMNSKFDVLNKIKPPTVQAATASQITLQKNSLNASESTVQMSKSPSSSFTPVVTMASTEPLSNAAEQFESLSLALETSLATADYQHAFDTYIALQSALVHLHDQQKKQQRSFQDRLNQFKTKLFTAVQESTTQFQSVMQELYLQIGQIKQLVDQNQTDAASTQYASVKNTIEQLPNNFSDKKEKLQDELLKVYLYLKDRSETHTANSFADISTDMKRLYVSAVAAIKSANFAQAQQLYEQLAAKYAQLPDGFTEQKVQLFDYVTFLHSQLTLDSALVAQTAMQRSPSPQTPTISSHSSSDMYQPVIDNSAARSVPLPPISSDVNNSPAQPSAGVKIPASMRYAQMKSGKLSSLQPSPSSQLGSNKFNLSSETKSEPTLAQPLLIPAKSETSKLDTTRPNLENGNLALTKLLQSAPKPELASLSKSENVETTIPSSTLVPSKIGVPKKDSISQKPIELNDYSAQQLQDRAKKLAARLQELKTSLEN